MPTTTSTPVGEFQSVFTKADREIGLSLFLNGAIAWNPENKNIVYFHHKATGLEERPRFVIKDQQGHCLLSFLATEEEAPTIANKKYAAWLKRQATQKH